MAEENYDEENILTPQPFPSEMVSDLDSKTVAETVREYLWSMEPIYYEDVSAQLKRDLVSRFVDFEMPDLPPENFRRVRILADLYYLKENLKFIESLLNKNESTPPELDRSIYSTIILREIGDDNQKKYAAQYYEYMVAHRFADKKFDSLLECLAVLGNDVRPNSLRSRMKQEAKSLAAREAAEPESGTKKRHIEGLADNEFFIIEEANKARARISNIAVIDERLLELIKVYLLLTEDEGGEYFALWTQQQIRRIAETEGKEKVIKAFRFVLSKLDKLEAEDELFCKVRTFNAVEFFDGELTESEAEFMKKNRRRQVDPLQLINVEPHIEPHEEEEKLDDDETEEESGNEN